MAKFVDREQDLADLNQLLSRRGAQFLIVYGRRRVGKTTLLTKWAAESGFPFVYWVASRNTPMVLRQGLAEALGRLESPQVEVPLRAGFTEAAQAEAAQHNAVLVDLATLDRDLCQQSQ